MDKKYAWTVIIAFLLITLFFMRKCMENNSNQATYFHNEGLIFGTVYNIKYKHTNNLADEITAELLKVDSTFSIFNPKSTISRINQNDTSVVLDEWFISLFHRAQQISEQTDGAFDITVAPLVNLWGFGFEKKDSVNQHVIDSLLQLVGYQKVHLSGNKIRKDNPHILLDVSAIAKGFSSDAIANLFESKNITDYLIEIGGEMRAKGVNQNGQTWTVGIVKPNESASKSEIYQKIHLFDKALATSGNYRNFYYKDGKKIAHTIDPKTGLPLESNLLSVSVITDDCTTADAFATAFMVMGLEKTKIFLKAHPELSAYLIYANEKSDLNVYYTDNFEQYLIEF